ncbi:hypothetical protein AB0O69_18535 [Streptomyces xiamenensis]|uniref:hypothetical protein n=1 Tax=Streptomyces xiamenensis TaxID=408015 RepID=UPI0034156808
MLLRRLALVCLSLGLLGSSLMPTASAATGDRHPDRGVQGVTAITRVHTYGQKIDAVAVEYAADVNPRTLGPDSYTVTDSVYNFRYDPIEDLTRYADREVVRVYTNDAPAPRPDGRSRTGRYVIVELAPGDPGGNTVIVSRCPTFLCSVKVNPEPPTRIVQNEPVHALRGNGNGRGPILAPASSAALPLTEPAVNLLVDDFEQSTYLHHGSVLPYAYHLPSGYDPGRGYPLMVILPGHGMGWDGENLGVSLAADIPATAWLTGEWNGTGEDVIVLVPQNQRVGPAAEAEIMTALVEDFIGSHAVDRGRVYASTVSYGSRLAWEAMAERPGLFTAALITGGFAVDDEQAARIASARTPIWVTHGLNDHLLPVDYGRDSARSLRDAYTAAGVDPGRAEDLVRYTEYGNEAFSEPDYHAAFGPTYEDASILGWLLRQGDR